MPVLGCILDSVGAKRLVLGSFENIQVSAQSVPGSLFSKHLPPRSRLELSMHRKRRHRYFDSCRDFEGGTLFTPRSLPCITCSVMIGSHSNTLSHSARLFETLPAVLEDLHGLKSSHMPCIVQGLVPCDIEAIYTWRDLVTVVGNTRYRI
jgi:hypothetical protein